MGIPREYFENNKAVFIEDKNLLFDQKKGHS